MGHSKERRRQERADFERQSVGSVDFEAWLRVFELARAQHPKVNVRELAEATGQSISALRKMLGEGYWAEWCPGPINAMLHLCSGAELEDLRDDFVSMTLNADYSNMPRYRLNRQLEGEYLGRGSWEDFGYTSLASVRNSQTVPLSKLQKSFKPSAKTSAAFSSNALAPKASNAHAKSSKVSASGRSQVGSMPGSPMSSADVVMPAYGPTLIQVNGNNASTYTEADVQRLREAAARSGLDLGQFAAALRAAMLQEMELIATVRGEALASIKGFRNVAEMLRRRMSVFARKMHEEELKGFPSMNAADPEKELRIILQFMEIQKRMGQIVGDVIESEQKRLGDAEAWRRRTDTLLFGSAGATAVNDAATGKADRMPPEQLEEIADWLKMPDLMVPNVKAIPATTGSGVGLPTQNSPQPPQETSVVPHQGPVTMRPGGGVPQKPISEVPLTPVNAGTVAIV